MDAGLAKKCPLCAEEIKAEALVCRYCGARFQVTRLGYCSTCHSVVTLGEGDACARCSNPVIDEFFDSRLIGDGPVSGPPLPAGDPFAAPPPPPLSSGAVPPPLPAPGSTGVPVGKVREGVVASVRMRLGFTFHGLAAAAVLIIVVLGWGGFPSLLWAQRSRGLVTEVAKPAPVFFVGAIVVLMVWAFGVRRLAPRRRTWSYARDLKRQRGIGLLLARRGLVGSVIAVIVLWLGLLASALYNLDDLSGHTTWTLRPGLYLALVLPIVAAAAAALSLPVGSVQRVHMDADGNLFD